MKIQSLEDLHNAILDRLPFEFEITQPADGAPAVEKVRFELLEAARCLQKPRILVDADADDMNLAEIFLRLHSLLGHQAAEETKQNDLIGWLGFLEYLFYLRCYYSKTASAYICGEDAKHRRGSAVMAVEYFEKAGRLELSLIVACHAAIDESLIIFTKGEVFGQGLEAIRRELDSNIGNLTKAYDRLAESRPVVSRGMSSRYQSAFDLIRGLLEVLDSFSPSQALLSG